MGAALPPSTGVGAVRAPGCRSVFVLQSEGMHRESASLHVQKKKKNRKNL